MAVPGLRQRDINGNVILDTRYDAINRVFDTRTLDGNAGSLTDARFAAGQPFAAIVPYSNLTTTTPPVFSFSGTTMSWTSGLPVSVMYGVGAGVSTYNTPRTGQAGFTFKNNDGTAVVLDHTMFALQLIGKGTVTSSASGAATVDVYCPDGRVPVVAIRNQGNYATYLAGVSMVNGTTCRITFGPLVPTSIEWFAFGRVYKGLSDSVGRRWYDSGGTLMGDTSVPMMRIVRANLGFTMYPGQTADFSEAGRKIAVVLNEPGFYQYKNAASGSGGNTTGAVLQLYRAGVTSLNDSSFRMSTVSIYSVSAGGTNEIRVGVNAKLSTIDVTNF